MSFTLQLNFEGLLHYVVNDLTGTGKNVRLCVVLPKGAGHTGKIYAGDSTTLGTADPDGVAIDGLRAVLEFKPIPTTNFDFDGPAIGGALKGAVPLDGLIGDSADKNLDIVAPAPNVLNVRSQVLIGVGGTFQATSSSTSPAALELPANPLNSQVKTPLDFADIFSMSVSNVETAQLKIMPLSDSVVTLAAYDITTTGATAFLTLSHTCFPPTVPRKPGDKDLDFRFHYMMLSALPGSNPTLISMPVPVITKFLGTSANFRAAKSSRALVKPDGCDCAGTRALPRAYDLDKFL
jgi:hypothetical protein